MADDKNQQSDETKAGLPAANPHADVIGQQIAAGVAQAIALAVNGPTSPTLVPAPSTIKTQRVRAMAVTHNDHDQYFRGGARLTKDWSEFDVSDAELKRLQDDPRVRLEVLGPVETEAEKAADGKVTPHFTGPVSPAPGGGLAPANPSSRPDERSGKGTGKLDK